MAANKNKLEKIIKQYMNEVILEEQHGEIHSIDDFAEELCHNIIVGFRIAKSKHVIWLIKEIV